MYSPYTKMGRRGFVKNSAATLALSILGPYALDITLPTQAWRVGLIGCGWYGKSDLFRLMQVADIEVVGICDVDRHQLEKAAIMIMNRTGQKSPPAMYKNYQRMLTQQDPEIVLIGSPDHWHALQAIDAIKSGAHVYLQKPISVDVVEGDAILAVAERYKRVVQVGLQRRSTPHLVEAKKEIIDKGMLGKISHVEMCCYYHMRANANPPVQRIPEFLDYEFWTGPAPYRPFDRMPHRGWWRAFMEYSNGIMGDMCVHMFDAVRWMLNLGWPKEIYSTGGIYVQKESKANTADTQTAVFSYDELECIWRHRTWGLPSDPEYPWAFFIYGEKGVLKGSVYKYEFISNDKKTHIKKDVIYEREEFPEDLVEPDIELHAAPATRRHMLDFIKSIKTGEQPVSNIQEGHISTASCIMANISMKLGRPIIYNPDLKFIENDREANDLLARDYREPWIHPL